MSLIAAFSGKNLSGHGRYDNGNNTMITSA
jgi:hypothetical protein